VHADQREVRDRRPQRGPQGKIADYLNNPTNQQSIRDFVRRSRTSPTPPPARPARRSGSPPSSRASTELLFGDDEKGKAHSFGEDIATALITGIMEGLGTAISLQGKLLKIFFNGPQSLIGRINESCSASTRRRRS
jgi:hypothetical protein